MPLPAAEPGVNVPVLVETDTNILLWYLWIGSTTACLTLFVAVNPAVESSS